MQTELTGWTIRLMRRKMEDSGVWRMSCLDMERDISMDHQVNKDQKEVYGLVFY